MAKSRLTRQKSTNNEEKENVVDKENEASNSNQSTISQFFRKKSMDEKEQHVATKSFQDGEMDIPCPICSKNIGNLGAKLRNSHVNSCVEAGIDSQVVGHINTVESIDVDDEEVIVKNGPKDAEDGEVSDCGDDKKDDDGGDVIEVLDVNVKKKEVKKIEKVKKVEVTTTTDNKRRQEIKETTIKKRKQSPTAKQRMIPFYKVMHIGNEKIAVDAFNYGPITGVKTFFLTHYHSDHYGGLCKSWDHGLIYCTEVTARLCQTYLDVNPKILRPMPMNEWCMVDGIEVLFLNANHCPGAAIILFKAADKTILHCGDFRASQKQIQHLKPFLIDIVYLDTTYLAPSHCFPSQENVIKACGDYVIQLRDSGANSSFVTATIDKFFGSAPSQNKPLILVGTYTIGKERVAIHIAKRLETTIFAQRRKFDILKLLNDPELDNLLGPDGFESAVHLVPMRDINFESLEKYFKPLSKIFTHCLAISPTGWSYHPKKDSKPIQPSFSCQNLVKTRQVRGKIQIFKVPYSEHSSFTELQDFCQNLSIKKVIPTVNTSSPENIQRMHSYLDTWIDNGL